MRPDRVEETGFPLARVAAFTALAALASAQWMRLVEDPPAGRVAIAAAAVVCGAVLVALVATRRPSRAAAAALAAVVMLATTAGALIAIGIPGHLLEPGEWGSLGSRIGDGLSGLRGDVSYPYYGGKWTRVVILAGLPLAIGLAAALAFWPRRNPDAAPLVRRGLPLVILVATFAMGVTIVAPERPMLWGFLLLLGIVAWRWLPSLPRREAISATVIVAAAGALALPLASAIDGDEPLLEFRNWEIGRYEPATFDWNHSYGPIDWPREGTALAAIRSDRPQYWKQAVLDEFEGEHWVRSERTTGRRLDLPTQVEENGPATPRQPHTEWLESLNMTIGPFESEFVLGSGTLLSVNGIEGVLAQPDGTVTAETQIEEGDSYAAVAYVPDPTPRQLRNAPPAYPKVLERYTQVAVPSGSPGSTVGPTASAPPTPIQFPLRGSADPADDRAAHRAIADSPYASTYRLAHRLTGGEPTAYAAAHAIERYLQTGFTYSEGPPAREHPLPAFLFRDRLGYCQHFAGAMALMLRMSGIPSRVVSGFSPGTEDPEIKHRFLVEDLDAHSWVEAYFPTIGWVTFDPTPLGGPATGRAPASRLAGDLSGGGNTGDTNPPAKQFIPGSRASGGIRSSDGGDGTALWIPLAVVAALALIALAVLGARTAARRLRYRRLSPAARADAHLRELPTALARLGWPLDRADTLLALESRLRRYRKDPTARYVAKLRTGRFSPTPTGIPTLADRRAAREDLGGGNLRDRLRGWFALPPGGPG